MEIEKAKKKKIGKYYHNGVYHSDVDILLKSDYDDLKKWYDSSIIPFKNYQGNVTFYKETTFPRYKFTEYIKENKLLIRKVRDLQNTNSIILNTEEFNTNFRYVETSSTFLELVAGTYNNVIQNVYVENNDNKLNINVKEYIEFYPSTIKDFEYLIHLYNNFNHVKILNILDVVKELNTNNVIIDYDYYKQLNGLLKSSDHSYVKMGMEMLTNVNVQSSLLWIMLLVNQNFSNIFNNSYYNSVSFKAFRENLETIKDLGVILNRYYFESRRDEITILKEFLRSQHNLVKESDIGQIKEMISNYLKEEFSFDTSGFQLSIDSIILKSEENDNILRMETIEEVEEVKAVENV